MLKEERVKVKKNLEEEKKIKLKKNKLTARLRNHGEKAMSSVLCFLLLWNSAALLGIETALLGR